MYDGMKDEMITKESWVEANKIQPEQHVDCGALSGDTGDNIFGIPGWGEKGALKAIQIHGSYGKFYEFLHAEFDSIRKDYPDITGDEFLKLQNLRTEKEQEKFDAKLDWKGKYPEITEGMPFSGVALAFEEKRWKPKKTAGAKANIMALMFEERVHLAYSLKRMDSEIEGLPDITPYSELSKEKINQYFEYYEISELDVSDVYKLGEKLEYA
jgi:5'-3' exonuclease